MRPFHCGRCGQTVFFENSHCARCGATLAFDPAALAMRALAPDEQVTHCGNREAFLACNWLLDDAHPSGLCRSCRLNRLVPDLSQAELLQRWQRVGQAQRRALYGLLRWGLAPEPKAGPQDRLGLALDCLAPLPGQPVLTGHADGVITLNLQEADDVQREAARAAFGEPWRTLLGHLRHELGHYLQHRHVLGNAVALTRCRALFGDESQDYASALQRHHLAGPPAGWEQQYISAYASAHPMEDFAETCAHLMLVTDAVETAAVRSTLMGDTLVRVDR